MKLPRPQAKRARIEIIPMIDAMFFLLVFFMFSSLSMVHMKGMPVALPRPAKAVNGPHADVPQSRLLVAVNAKGDYFLNDGIIKKEALPELLARYMAGHKDAVVIVNIAPNQTTQHLIGIMDTVNAAVPPGQTPPPILIATEAVTAPGTETAP